MCQILHWTLDRRVAIGTNVTEHLLCARARANAGYPETKTEPSIPPGAHRLMRESRNETLTDMVKWETSGQDGVVGRHTLAPCTTKRRMTTNLKTKNKQN